MHPAISSVLVRAQTLVRDHTLSELLTAMDYGQLASKVPPLHCFNMFKTKTKTASIHNGITCKPGTIILLYTHVAFFGLFLLAHIDLKAICLGVIRG